ncbi:non-ribosomal peptide synthetase [Chitinophaga vietnamensis]|uniref:non-ribosomal peptide synthetase n=1 Tax=Chitinophaga vietnamensis TaxID=2593957 RepID=UPI001177C678|nr:non-ribosomal peptide synthetase [Chitinophaga vietnamensis]
MNEKNNIQKIYPLTAMQEGMLFHTLYGGNHAYFNQVCYRTAGALQPMLLEQALDILSERHDILRTAFVYEKNERPIQVVLKNRRIGFSLTDISHLDTKAANAFVARFRQEDIARSFDLLKDPLMRLAVIKMKGDEYAFIWSHHHILLDGWCIPVLLNELVTIYHTLAANKPLQLPPPVSFATYIQWLEKQDKQEAAAYWQHYLNGYTNIAAVPPVLFPGDNAPHQETATEKLSFSPEITAQLEALARKEQVTMNVLFQTLWGLLVAAYNNTTDVVYGNVVSGRPSDIPGVEEILGLFINTVPLRIRFEQATRFSELLRQVHHDSIESLPYHYSPLAEIQAGSALKRDLLQHIIAVENYPLEESIRQSGSSGDIFDVKEVEMFEQTNYHFHINVMLAAQMEVIMSYDPSRYTAPYIKGLLQQLESLAVQVLRNEDIPVKQLRIEVPVEVSARPAYQQAYWKRQLAGVEPLQLPTDKARLPLASNHAAIADIIIPKTIRDHLAILSFDENTTLPITLLAAFHALLYRYTGQDAVATGIPVSREHGLLPLCTHINEAPLFINLLQQVKEQVREAAAHQEIQLPADSYRVTFNWPDALPIAEHTAYDLEVAIKDQEENIQVRILYATDLFTADTIHRMLGHYLRLLESISADPAKAVASLPMLSSAEEQQLLAASAERTAGYPIDKTIVDLIEEQVACTPDNIAVTMGAAQLTYRELNERANRLAHYLRSKGVGADALVPVCLYRSMDMIIALLGVLKAGGAYVPIDPEYPQDRIAFMLEDTAAPVVVTSADVAADIQTFTNAEIILIDEHREQIHQQAAANPSPLATPAHLAYVIYTSGSTGKPKGVLIEHRNVVRLFETDAPLYDFTERDVWTMFHSFCFDFSVWEMYGALFYGGRLVMVPKNIAKDTAAFAALLADEGVTVLNQTPSAFYVLQEYITAQPMPLQVRYVIFGGEALNPAAIRPWKAQYPACRMINMYGITETTVHVTYQEINEREMESSSSVIGMPIPTLGLYILDARLQLAPTGVPGELYVSGAGLARGYLHRDELTKERFITNPYDHTKTGRLYKTGDQARWLPDGNIEYLGRIDNQVKIRGFRIELGEIETALQQSGFVKQAVVIADTDPAGAKRLVGYVLPDGPFQREALLSYLKERLPDYMVPAILIPVPFFQLTSNGKTDRRALPHPDTATPAVTAYAAPSNDTESALAAIWQKLLGAERIGVDDHFFELGGHSLSAIRLIAAVNKHFDTTIKVSAIFEYPTVRSLAKHIAKGSAAYQSIPVAPLQPHYPLSHAQQRLWLIYQLDEERNNYNMPVAFTFKGALDIAAFSAAFNLLVVRHEILRTTFLTENGEPRQQVQPIDARFALQVADIRGEEVNAKAAAVAAAAFDLEQAPLFRAQLWQTGDAEYVFLLVVHHIITDAWSTGILLRDLMLFYGGMLHHDNPLPPPLPIQYKDFAAWDLAQTALPAYQQHRRYWLDQFREPVNILELPADYPRQSSPQKGQLVYDHLSPDLTRQLKNIAAQQGVSLFMLLLAGFKALLHRYTGQQDIVVGMPSAGREHPDLAEQAGFYVNTLPLRSRFDADAPFTQLLDTVKVNTLAAFEHQQYPFDTLVEELAIPREAGRSPLFDIMFVLQQADIKQAEQSAGFDISPLPMPSQGTKFDLTIELWEEAEGLQMSFEYNAGLFTAARIRRMTAHYAQLLSAVVANLQSPVAQLEYMSNAEKHHLLHVLSGKSDKLPADSTVTKLFEARAAQYPDATAVADEQRSYTYQQLNAKANQLAAYIRERYTGGVVAVILPRSVDFVVAILAILKAGAAYLPLETNTPQERIDLLLAQTNAALVINEAFLRDTNVDGYPQNNPVDVPLNGDSLAYIMFTSGSTGTPKGVMVKHKSIVRLVKDTNYITLSPDDKILLTGSLSFDAATFEIWGALLNGAQVRLMDLLHLLDTAQLSQAIQTQGITTMWFTASWFNQLADQDPALFRPLKHILAGGEQLSPAHIRKVQAACPGIRITNGYGPTENTTFSICGEVPLFPESAVPLGRPISHSTVYIVDARLQPVAVGIPGEILLGGEGLSAGYIGDEVRTAKQFIPHPFEAGEKVYRSGDLGRWLEDGTVAFLGRSDDQVKIRGYRVEPGEIAHAVKQLAHIREAFVSVEKNLQGDKLLVCFFTASEPLPAAVLKAALKATLPDYMIPALFVQLEQAPLNKNGKLDRNALPDITALLQEEKVEETPATATEAQLLALWQAVLGRKGIGMQDNFFEAGGSSLLAYRIIAQLAEATGKKIGLAAFFKNPDIRSLAQWLDGMEAAASGPIPLVPAAPLYEASRAQQRLWIMDKLETEKNAFNITGAFRIDGPLDIHALEMAINQVIARHEILRTVFVEQEGQPYQRILPEAAIQLPVSIASAGTDINRLGAALLREEEQHIFRLDEWPLLRFRLATREEEHVLLVNMHHIISDGWSLQLFYTETLQCYHQLVNGIPAALPPLRIQYKDFAAWQYRQLQQAAHQDERYWLQQLQRDSVYPDLPLDKERTRVRNYSSHTLRFTLEEATLAAFRRIAAAQDASLFMVCQSLVVALLQHYQQTNDITVGATATGREHPDLQHQMGFYVNVLALRTRLYEDDTFLSLLEKVKATTLAAYDHQFYPFDLLIEKLKQKRDLGRNPLFDVMIAFNDGFEAKAPEGASTPVFSELPLENREGTNKYDITFFFESGEAEGLHVALVYNKALFHEHTMETMLQRFAALAAAAAADPGKALLAGKPARQEIISIEDDFS